MIIKRKTYETLKNNNQFLAKVNAELRKDNLEYQEIDRGLNNLCVKLDADLTQCKKEIKNLKSLCTKHGVDYKSLYKEKK